MRKRPSEEFKYFRGDYYYGILSMDQINKPVLNSPTCLSFMEGIPSFIVSSLISVIRLMTKTHLIYKSLTLVSLPTNTNFFATSIDPDEMAYYTGLPLSGRTTYITP